MVSFIATLSATTTCRGRAPLHPKTNRLGYGTSSGYVSIVSPVARTVRTSPSEMTRSNIRWTAWSRNTSRISDIVGLLHREPNDCHRDKKCPRFQTSRGRGGHGGHTSDHCGAQPERTETFAGKALENGIVVEPLPP